MNGEQRVNDPVDYCGDAAALAGYLYDECDPAERDAIAAHLAVCVTCAAELAALGATRTALASWTPPEAALGFRITSRRDEPQAPAVAAGGDRWWSRPLPAWAQAAAAMLIFVAGAALGMRGAASAPASPAPSAIAAGETAAPAAVTAAEMERLERDLRREIQALRVASPAPPVSASGDDQLLQRIRRLMAESEERQQRELAVRLSQVLQEVESQRRLDLARIEQTFGQMEGATRPELVEQRRLLNYLIRNANLRAVSQRPQ